MIVLFGATGDLARRKLLPGLFHLAQAGLLPEYRILGTSLEDFDDDGFRTFARAALDEFARHGVPDDAWHDFVGRLAYLPQTSGPDDLATAVAALDRLGDDAPSALPEHPPSRWATYTLGEAEHRIVIEKPFGTDLGAIGLNHRLRAADEARSSAPTLPRQEAALNILAFRFANGLFDRI
jgi:glucose-6-phosphate 1-dehydrogenase